MNCDNAKLKIQAFIDDELNKEEMIEVLDHVESCYKCRDEFLALKNLNKMLRGVQYPQPNKEWFEKKKHPLRMFSSLAGKVVFFSSYLFLLAYMIITLFIKSDINIALKIGIFGVLFGLIVLFGVTLSDRIRENKDDKYKGVQK